MTAIMTPDHLGWPEFCDLLAGPSGCNFREGPVWDCHGDHRFSRKLLPTFGVDVEASVEFFVEHGGHCDCEVLFNLNPE
ncbi:MAG: hypothetical protein QOG67_3057 [Verrucomicrobiota bacterium]|jgi:hypothetical protein